MGELMKEASSKMPKTRPYSLADAPFRSACNISTERSVFVVSVNFALPLVTWQLSFVTSCPYTASRVAGRVRGLRWYFNEVR